MGCSLLQVQKVASGYMCQHPPVCLQNIAENFPCMTKLTILPVESFLACLQTIIPLNVWKECRKNNRIIMQSIQLTPLLVKDIIRHAIISPMIADIAITEKSFGAKMLMTDVKFSVNDGEKVGLVGRNGVDTVWYANRGR